MIYLDYQATTPLAPEAAAAMRPYLDGAFGNPHSPHRPGREAAAAVAVAHDRIVAALEAPAGGRLVFTSGATEAVNQAIAGSLTPARRRIVTIATEHACVFDTVAALARAGRAEAVVLPVGPDGLVDLDAAATAIDGTTALVAAMLVNNEIGVVQPIAALASLARAAGARMLCDAVQGFGRVPLPIADCDMVALSAHKIHGPKGIGALWLAPGIDLPPLLHGGGQQGGLRPGTLAPMLCDGFGVAARLAAERADGDAAHVAALADRARVALGEGWGLNGAEAPRYAGNLNLRRAGLDAARLISDCRGLAISAGSACASGSGRPSHVLAAIGLDDRAARSSLRIGFGRYTTEAEIDEGMAMIARAAAAQGSRA
ncbi:MAG: cysteine desulfurase family protein [Sphingomonas fennica]